MQSNNKTEVATQNVLVSAKGDMAVIAGVINKTFKHIKYLLEEGEIVSKITFKGEELIVDYRFFDDNWKYWELVAGNKQNIYLRLNVHTNCYYIKLQDLVAKHRFQNTKVIDLHKLSLIYHILQEKYDIVEKQYLCNVQLKQKGF